jgi:hypothetical protein
MDMSVFACAYELTVAVQALLVNTYTHNHHIVHNRKTAFAADPLARLVHDANISQDGRFVGLDSAPMELAGVGHVVFGEE